MTEDQIKEYLKNRGCPEFVWRGGSENLLRRWKDFVEQVEKGYCANCLIQEYWNDLDIRELIHDVGIENTVTELDQRFTEMLTSADIKHWHTDRNSTYDFWNYGYPKNATGLFYEDVRRYILRDS